MGIAVNGIQVCSPMVNEISLMGTDDSEQMESPIRMSSVGIKNIPICAQDSVIPKAS